MISEIKNITLRRSILVASIIFLAPTLAILGVIKGVTEVFIDFGEAIIECWRGR